MNLHNYTNRPVKTALAALSLIIALLASACSSPNNFTVRTGSGTAATAQPANLETYMTDIMLDVASDWQARFQRVGHTFQPVHYEWVTGYNLVLAGNDGDCGYAGDSDYYGKVADPAFACPSDLTIYLSVDWIRDNIWSQGGAFAVGTVLAHEFFHLVQAELSITLPPDAPDLSPIELDADCGAGVWAHDKYYTGQLQGNDISIAANLMSDLGDTEFSLPDHHGTPNQRRAAFMLGYNSGDVGKCTLNLPQKLPKLRT